MPCEVCRCGAENLPDCTKAKNGRPHGVHPNDIVEKPSRKYGQGDTVQDKDLRGEFCKYCLRSAVILNGKWGPNQDRRKRCKTHRAQLDPNVQALVSKEESFPGPPEEEPDGPIQRPVVVEEKVAEGETKTLVILDYWNTLVNEKGPVPGAIKLVEKHVNSGARVVCLTYNLGGSTDKAERGLKRHGFPLIEVFGTKEANNKGKTVAKLVMEMERNGKKLFFVVFYEDKAPQLESIMNDDNMGRIGGCHFLHSSPSLPK